MWGLDASNLEAAVGARIPVRFNTDDRYFTDSFQALPSDGYTKLFENILDHPKIQVSLGIPYNIDKTNSYSHQFLSISIDQFFKFCHGELPYRSINFHNFKEASAPQQVATINFTDTFKYTRKTEWDLIPNSPNHLDRTMLATRTITYEEPCDPSSNNGEKYYPVRNSETLKIYEKYCKLAARDNNVTFIGRTGLFKYLDMVPAISTHLKIARDYISTYL